MILFISIILAIHFVLGYGFCYWIAGKRNISSRWYVKAVTSLLTSLVSIPLVVGLFAFTPGLRSLPGSFMEGALFVTFPLFFGVFTLIYFFVAKSIFKYMVRVGYASQATYS